MAHILPFRGVLYDPAVVKDIAQVVAPPYDVIDEAGQEALYARHPNNVIRLEFGQDHPGDGPTHNKYTRAAVCLRDWLTQGALRREAVPAIYPYAVEYRVPSSVGTVETRVLKGFMSNVELEEFGSGKIYPHENTRAAAKADRFQLLETCRANFSPIFSLFSDPQKEVQGIIEQVMATQPARFEFHDDEGFRERLWTVTDRAVLDRVVAGMSSKPLFIADGHHRYETALNYRRSRREQSGATSGLQPFDSVLMLFACLEDPGLTVLPTHRMLTKPLPTAEDARRRLADAFDIEVLSYTAGNKTAVRARFLDTMRHDGQTKTVFGLVLKGESAYWLLRLKESHRPSAASTPRDRLDVSILQSEVLSRLLLDKKDEDAITYTKDDHEAVDWVRQGKAEGALVLNATKVSEVRDVAASGGRMPHKSTYFFPKPLTGLVMNVLDESLG